MHVKPLWLTTRPRRCARHPSRPMMPHLMVLTALANLSIVVTMFGMDPATFLSLMLAHLATPVCQTSGTATLSAVITSRAVWRSSVVQTSSDATMTACGRTTETESATQVMARSFGLECT